MYNRYNMKLKLCQKKLVKYLEGSITDKEGKALVQSNYNITEVLLLLTEEVISLKNDKSCCDTRD